MQAENTKNAGSFPGWGDRLRQARKAKGLSQADLARALGYKRETSISEIENGRVQTAPLPVLAKLAEVLDVDLHWLITGRPSPLACRIERRFYRALSEVLPLAEEETTKLLQLVRLLRVGPGSQIRIMEPGLEYALIALKGDPALLEQYAQQAEFKCLDARSLLLGPVVPSIVVEPEQAGRAREVPPQSNSDAPETPEKKSQESSD